MGKFDGVLFCSDMDGTMLDSDKKISKKNIDAVSYFKSEGGIFSIITGRTIAGTMPLADKLNPNAPIGCLNGGLMYDIENDEITYREYADESLTDIVKNVYENYPFVGIEICKDRSINCVRDNEYIKIHRKIAGHEYVPAKVNDIGNDTVKVLFALSPDRMDEFKSDLLKISDPSKLVVEKSYYCFVEILSHKVNKGRQLLRLYDTLKDRVRITVAAGDNDNDASMIECADIGYAVGIATKKAKDCADFVTVSCDEDAIYKIIEGLENDIKNWGK